jgi:chromatin assembly factor 1 subunit B
MFFSIHYNCVEGASGVLTESVIIIWKQKTDQDAPDFPSGDSDSTTKEQWLGIRLLRGHMEDIYDLSWSPDSLNLISGSVDNSAIVWDVHKGI